MSQFARLIDRSSVNLYSAASNLTGNGNLLISPISLVYASMLVYLGAKGETKANFDKVYKFNKSPDLTIKPFKDSFDAFQSRPHEHEEGELVLQFVTAVFIQNELKVEPNYMNAVKTQTDAVIEQKDFINNAEVARNEINSWVQEKTKDKIKDLIPSGAVTSRSRAVLVNALYFKAAWDEFFEESETRPDKFTLLDGSTKQVDFMNSFKNKHQYFDDVKLNAQYLEIPYKNGEASLLIILPKKVNGLREVEAKLNAGTFSRLASKASSDAIILTTIPKLKIESSSDAKTLLRKIGLTHMFTEDANLTGIATARPRLQVSDAFHKTFIEVDEKGTEATAASTSSEFTLIRPAAPEPPAEEIVFKADHPFLFAIRHDPTKLILFTGRVEDI